jgi:4-amino-4-deoxy-L-arabinose transferase-like glycosyltransferase
MGSTFPATTLRRVAVPVLAFVVLCCVALRLYPGPQGNDFPLLMWLAYATSFDRLAPSAIGHFGFAQPLLVRLLVPDLGDALTAAKILNILSALGILGLVKRLVERLTASAVAAWLATLCLGTATAFVCTTVSEFADPLATFFFVLGLVAVFDGPAIEGSARRLVLGGVCFGVAGWFRIHFQVMGVVAMVMAGLAELQPRRSARLAGFGLLGVLLGALPAALLNLSVHGTPFSPVASYFLGQVVYGVDHHDFLGTYAHATTLAVLRDAGGTVLRLMLARVLDDPWPLLTSVLLIAVARWAPALASRDRRLLGFFACFKAFYFFAFLSVGWEIADRHLFPLAVIDAICVGALVAYLPKGFEKRRAVPLVVAALVALEGFETYLHLERSNALWERSVDLERELSRAGMTDTDQVFVFSYDRFPTRDPKFVAYRNFGWWNTVSSDFMRERPPPTGAELDDAASFDAFLRKHGIRFLVLDRTALRHRGTASAYASGTAPDGFAFLGRLDDEIIFKAVN